MRSPPLLRHISAVAGRIWTAIGHISLAQWLVQMLIPGAVMTALLEWVSDFPLWLTVFMGTIVGLLTILVWQVYLHLRKSQNVQNEYTPEGTTGNQRTVGMELRGDKADVRDSRVEGYDVGISSSVTDTTISNVDVRKERPTTPTQIKGSAIEGQKGGRYMIEGNRIDGSFKGGIDVQSDSLPIHAEIKGNYFNFGPRSEGSKDD